MEKLLRILNSVRLKNPHLKDSTIYLKFLHYYRIRIYKRFKILLYLGLFYTALLFLNNFIWPDSKLSPQQLAILRISDTGVFLINIIILIIEIHRSLKNKPMDGFIYQALVNIFIGSFLIWGAITSCIEIQVQDYMMTYFFTIAIFIPVLQKPAFQYSLIAFWGYLVLIIFLIWNISNNNITYYHFLSSTTLTVIGIYISDVLFNTWKNNFAFAEHIKQSNKDLDLIVQERTRELEGLNTKLLEEIDIRKQYEALLKEETNKAHEADKLKTTFLTNLSHEIRTPLNGIIGFSQLLGRKKLTHEKMKHYTDVIQKNSSQLLKTIEDIIDFSMLESKQVKLNYEEINLEHLMVSLYEQFENFKKTVNKEHVNIIYNKLNEPAIQTIRSDRPRMEQVLNNLIENAIKFTSEGSVRFGYTDEDGFIIFYVEDTGIGIPDESIQYIFKHFAQGDNSLSRKHGGNGLGLPIAKGIVEIIGGELWIDKTYTKGARFCFSVPV